MKLKHPHVVQRCAEFDALLQAANSWGSTDAKLGAHLAAYLSVLLSGIVEDCVEHLFVHRAKRTKDNEIENFVKHMMADHFRNPKSGTIANSLKLFSDAYRQTYISRIQPKEAEALASIINYKNSLAHEGALNLQMTINDVNTYYQSIIPILEAVDDILM